MDHSFPASKDFVPLSDLFKKDNPRFRAVMTVGKGQSVKESLEGLRSLSLDAVIQTIGEGHQQDPDIVWEQTDYRLEGNCPSLSPKNPSCCQPADLCSTMHVASMLSPAYKRIWQDWMTFAATREAIVAVSYPDSVWAWAGLGSGRSGYSPPTVAAFRADLQGRDGGLSVVDSRGRKTTVKFSQYAESYLGAKPDLALLGPGLGIRAWEQYAPPVTRYQEITARNRNRPPTEWEHDPQLTLFDLLVNYEWLKFQQGLAQFAVKQSRSQPLRYQVITNPEFMGNGTDWKWLSRLTTPIFAANEYFSESFVADGAYYQSGYFTDRRSPAVEVGVSMEVGGGGNSAPYHDLETAYALAYDLSASVQASWLESDFLPKATLAEMQRLCFQASPSKCDLHLRLLGLLSNGLGYANYQQDQPRRQKASLKVVTNRSLIRPYSTGWRPWEWLAAGGYDTTVNALMNLGYTFAGAAEDNEIRAELGGTSALIYEPLFPLQAGWDQIKQWLAAGKRTVLTNAYVWRKPGLSRRYSFIDGRAVEPALALDKDIVTCTAGSAITGPGLKRTNPVTYRLYTLAQPAGWQPLIRCKTAQGNLPLVSVRQTGQGKLMFMHLDPSEPAVKNGKIIDLLYTALLPQLGMRPVHQAEGASVHLFDGKSYNIAAIRSRKLDRFAPWRSPSPQAVAIRVPRPNQPYRVRYLLNNQETQARSDKQGWLRLNVPNNYELVFYQAQTSERIANASWKQLQTRSQKLQTLFLARTDPSKLSSY